MKHPRQSDTITTISFDGDATLWDFEKVMRYSLEMVLLELRQYLATNLVNLLSVDGMIHTRNIVAQELKGKETNLEKIRLSAFQRTLESIDIYNSALAHHINEVYLKHRFNDIELYPDVIPSFDSLTRDFKIGLLSNGNSYPERCGLTGYFNFVIFSQDYGVEKPDRRIFEIAIEKADCSVNELIHVGDSLKNDVGGAKNAGIKSIWLNRKRIQNESSIKPDFEITTLYELISICKQLRM
jgi:FMN hydrolase / 5-amino-6-(5-phospho-D-ribitylamino)uracil phosphatase